MPCQDALESSQILITVNTDVARDHDPKSQKSTTGDFGALFCLCCFSYSKRLREPLRSTIGIAVGSTAIEYEHEYRFAEYEYEYEHDEMRWDTRISESLRNLFTTK